MWVIDQLAPGNPAYNLPTAYRVRGALNVTALEQSFNEVIKRHEALRTTFTVENGEPLQRVHPELSIKLEVVPLDRLPQQECERTLHALASEESIKPFDLSRLPLIRVALFCLGEIEHVLLINLHHIVSDGASIALLLAEVDTFYCAFTSGGEPHPRALAVQYPDFAAWQQRTIADETVRTTQLEFWRTQLGGTLPVLDLPSDLPRPPVQSFVGSNVFFNIPEKLAQELRTLGAGEGCTVFMTVLAAFQVLLYRYSGAEDIIIGTPVATRATREVEPLIGNLLNVVAARCDLSGNPTFLELLRRARNTALNAFSNSDVPFETLIPHLTYDRDPGRPPVFQVLLQMLSTSAPRIGTLDVSSFHFDLKFSQVDLSLHLYEEATGYIGRFEYCADLFHPDTIERLSSNFLELLRSVVKAPEQHISKIPILAASERHRILHEWNNTSRDYPKDQCIHHLFEHTARRAANRTAVECGGQPMTYGELNAKANQLAHYLLKCGVAQGTLVGICLERSLDMIVGLLGLLKAGATYVPMDPSLPSERLGFMMADAGISFLVTQAALRDRLSRSGLKAVCVDTDSDAICREPCDNPRVSIGPSSVAYTIYTSGSTGTPKGVLIEHRSVVNLLTSMQQTPGFEEHDVLVAVTTISFDIAALEMFLPLTSGGKLVIACSDEVLDGRLLLNLIERSGATILQATPATWKLMIDAGWKGTPDHLPGLKMLCGGEAMPCALANRMLVRGRELWNMYGPTETTIWSAVGRIEPGDETVLIGPPIANTQLYIVDQELEPVPIGVAGELLIGGDGVAKGYLNRPDLTVERFVENPFRAGGGPVYRSGDLARFRSDGRLEFRGRRDFQVKVRGYRIELGEIERVLTQHPGIKDAVVMTWDDHDGDRRLAAYYIPATARPTTGELRKALQEKLPEYMIPSRFIEMDALPLTSNGKIDRTAIPRPDVIRFDRHSGAVALQSELELRLAAIWGRALRKYPIGATDNFFELGGHSLLAAQVFAQIEGTMGMRLPLALLFQAPTVRQLAEKIEQRAWRSNWKSLVPIQTAGERPPLFVVHAAEGNVLRYRHLARTLGPSQPVYGLQSRGLDGSEPMETTIEGMAARYLAEIRSVQPYGPYYLAGYCLGGAIALEIAQQLKRAGERVALLAMFETYNLPEESVESLPLRGIHKAQNLYFHLRNVLLSLSHGTVQFFKEKLRFEIERLRVRGDILLSRVSSRFNRGRAPKYQHLRVTTINERAAAAYHPLPYDGTLVLFRPRAHFLGFNEWSFGWQSVARQGVQVVEMPNYPRGSLNDPFVEILADRLRGEIDKIFHLPEEARRAV
jgi:aspartate racemase